MLISSRVPREAVILAGGRGTRLAAVLPETPKPIAPVAGRPFLSFIVEYVLSQGVEKIIISTGYKAELVKSVMESAHPNVKLYFSREEEPLGTGGGIMHALPLIDGSDFLVLNGDTHFQFSIEDLYAIHKEKAADLTMALRNVDDVGRFGAVETKGSLVTGFKEKGEKGPGRINAGTYIIKRHSLTSESFPKSFSFENYLLPFWTITHKVASLLVEAPFLDLGVPEDYSRAAEFLS